MPRQHAARFEDADDDLLAELAACLVTLVSRLEAVAGRPAYNLLLHTVPAGRGDFHWHFEMLPRLTGVAGFEWGTGVYINPVPPEEAARRLRGE